MTKRLAGKVAIITGGASGMRPHVYSAIKTAVINLSKSVALEPGPLTSASTRSVQATTQPLFSPDKWH